ncbi:3-hydroxyacyl-CoA dehydrogenase NAD-binding domain-containing protein [Jatrophihabitans telluris]|uniref:3-hydroxyacyl-CoA dehydrogenase NAD-binding domain-containing protein n=1 Tax=Jatrophihabitans telluris TaxID=2038343 RepID=A0ABY4QU81_9ACTN|nr:3-hydroxyacyl-CoA dehydrogenase NAD-binding domain-containing protein [Jatrophihabitans telluris]UQX86692.1 3-hydroxyacyl-CoA dehydrogenase NAD-binding domain-containing protein [Jatrophihabitans telluris]
MSTAATTTPDFADEVVTRALVTFLEVPALAGELALITLDNGHDHTRPSTFGPAGLRSLDAAVDTVTNRSPKVSAVAVTGKPFIFAVGADITGVGLINDREQALAVARQGHDVFARIRDLDVPTFAFVNGAVMGGGLELALHCDYRTVSNSAAAIAFPECFLGLVPGWGGTQLLPNLIGARAAITVIVENALNQNKMLNPKQATDLGIFDQRLDSADFLAESLRWAAQVLSGQVAITRPEVDRGDGWDSAVLAGRAFVDLKVAGAAPAPYRALDLIALAKTADFATGTAAEDDALADLIMTDELRAGLYAFDLVNKRAKRPAGAPDKSLARKLTKVGIVGAGLMAGQMALLFARRLEVPVVLTDLDQTRLDRGVGYVHSEIDQLLAKRRINPDKANRLKDLVTGSLTKDAFADADFVIEAVFEEMSIKRAVFEDLEQYVKPDAILATNTSSLSITEMAQGLSNPERVVGFHFFNPVAIMPLVEIVRGEQTDEPSLATAFALAKQLKKTAVGVKDSPSFIVNRLLGRFMGEVSRVVDEGTPIQVADASVGGLAPMAPFVLLALVGPAIALHNAETLHAAFGDRFYVSDNLRRIVELGKPGIYLWDSGKPEVDPELAGVFQTDRNPVELSPSEVRERVLRALAEEARLMLDEGVAAEPQDLDLAMITGAGFSFFNGGLTPLLDRTGTSESVTGHRFLPSGTANVAGVPH